MTIYKGSKMPKTYAGQLFMTKAETKRLPVIGVTEGQGWGAIAQVKFFCPASNFRWYAVEWDGEDRFYGLITNDRTKEAELGYFSMKELLELRAPMKIFGVQVEYGIERDLRFAPKPLRACAINDGCTNVPGIANLMAAVSRVVYYIDVGDDFVEVRRADVESNIEKPLPTEAWERQSFKTIPEMDGECEDEIGKVREDVKALRDLLNDIRLNLYECWISTLGKKAIRATEDDLLEVDYNATVGFGDWLKNNEPDYSNAD